MYVRVWDSPTAGTLRERFDNPLSLVYSDRGCCLARPWLGSTPARMARLGWLGPAWHRVPWRGVAPLGLAWRVEARPGEVWPGVVGLGKARLKWAGQGQ
jgi:hypothetical protein